jgi:hypothetical protein
LGTATETTGRTFCVEKADTVCDDKYINLATFPKFYSMRYPVIRKNAVHGDVKNRL